MESLQQQLADLKVRRHQQELEIANIENYALRQRFQDILDNLLQEQLEKEQQVGLVVFYSKFVFLYLFCKIFALISRKVECFSVFYSIFITPELLYWNRLDL